MQQSTELVLPDLFTLTPFPWAGCNPLFSPNKRESTEWMLDYGWFSAEKERRGRMGAANAELLGAYAYPYADAECMRLVCDLLMILFVLDEITDAQDAESAKATRDTFVKALTGDSDKDNSPITLFTKDYMARLSTKASKETRERFVDSCIAYIEATAREAHLRETNEVPSMEEYVRIRRETGGVRSCFDLIEVVLGITLPAALFEDPNFLCIYHAAVDMIDLANDVYSYSVEYTSGMDGCNAINVLMHAKGLSTEEAMNHIAEIYKGFADTILTCKEKIRSFGPAEDEAIRSYIYGMEQWVYGNLIWSFDIERYFGKEHEEVKRTGIVKLVQRAAE